MSLFVCSDECLYEYTYVSYRVNDSPEGLEASPYRKHMFHSVCNSCKLEKHTDTEMKNCICFFFLFATSSISFCGSYLSLVEFFDPYTVNNGSHRPGPLCLQEKKRTNKPQCSETLVDLWSQILLPKNTPDCLSLHSRSFRQERDNTMYISSA